VFVSNCMCPNKQGSLSVGAAKRKALNSPISRRLSAVNYKLDDVDFSVGWAR